MFQYSSTEQLISNEENQLAKENTNFHNKHIENEIIKYKYKLIPPDGGWGWLVLCGSTIVNLLIPGSIKSFGVLFVEFIEEFHSSPATASWIPAICYFLYCCLGPLTSYFSTKSSYRTVTLIGGTCASAGMILSSFATTITQLYFSYGVLVGIGAGLSYPPSIFIITSYFEKHRGLANGIAISGSAIGSMILPPFLQFLLENYGLQGAVLIMGGVTLNACAAALLYHPVKWHMKRSLIPIFTVEKKLDSHHSTDDGFMPQKTENDSKVYTIPSNGKIFNYEKCNNIKSGNSVKSLKNILAGFFRNNRSYPELPAQIKQLELRDCYHKPKISNNKNRSQVCKLLKDPKFIILLLSCATNAIGYANFVILLPSYAVTLNFNKSMSSYLLSVIGVFDLFGRIGGSTISDYLSWNKKNYFISGLFVSGVSLAILPLMALSYPMICAICAVFGFSSGIYIGITTITMIDLLGEDLLASSYTISLFVNGIFHLIGPPICGSIYEITNSYDTVIISLGLTLISGAAVWIFLPCIVTCKSSPPSILNI